MNIGMIGAFVRNNPFGTEIAFKKGLEQMPDCKVYAFDPSSPNSNLWVPYGEKLDAVIVFKNACGWDALVEEARDAGAKTIVYQPDDSRAPGIYDMLIETRVYCDYAFTFDFTGAQAAESIGYKKAKKLLVTADPTIYRPMTLQKDIDFCFVGSISNPVMHASRRRMVNVLRNNGMTVSVTDGQWNPHEINKIYNRSKVVLNHATDVGQDFGSGWGYQCRHFEAGLARSCLLSNSIIDRDDSDPENFFCFGSEVELVERARELLHDDDTREDMAARFYDEISYDHCPMMRACEITQFVRSL